MRGKRGAWVSAIVLFSVPAFASQTIIRNYNTARDKFFYKKLCPHGGWTVYCGKRWRTKRGLNVEHVRRGKYFRIVADVILDGESLAPMLIAKGLGVPYHGGRKTWPWC